MNIKITKDKYSVIVDLYNDGYTATKIAEIYNVSIGTICNILKSSGVDIRKDHIRKYSNFSDEDIKNIIKLYGDGNTAEQIGFVYNVCKSHISKILKKNGMKARDYRKIPVECFNEIAEKYKNGMSSYELAHEYSVDKTTIIKILNIIDVDIRDPSHAKQQYMLNENYFDCINSQNKAYILGFLYSDGNKTKNTISIALQEQDKEILEKINQELGSNRPLLYIDNIKSNKSRKNAYSLSIVNKHMAESLEKYGVVENKSLIIQFPNWLDDKLYPGFIRGLLDGDGHIDVIEDNKGNFSVTITGTMWICEKLKEIIEDKLDIHCGIYDASCHNGITKVFCISGKNQVKKFLDYIYEDAELYLKRKYDVYKTYYM